MSQSWLPPHSTLLSITLSSDKTKLSVMTGNHTTHPLLITLANINSTLWSLISSHTFSLLALFLFPKFLDMKKGLNGILKNQLLHSCLNFVTNCLKLVSCDGAWLSDCAGNIWLYFTPLVSYIIDMLEAMALTGVAGKTSYLTIATYKEFGDPFWHESQTTTSILTSLRALASKFDPQNVAVTGGKGAWKPVITCWVHLELMCIFPTM